MLFVKTGKYIPGRLLCVPQVLFTVVPRISVLTEDSSINILEGKTPLVYTAVFVFVFAADMYYCAHHVSHGTGQAGYCTYYFLRLARRSFSQSLKTTATATATAPTTNNQQQLAPFLRSDGTGRGVASHTPIHRRALRLYTYLTPNVATVSILIFNPSGPHNSGRSGITLL